jgi:hypothetical protein
MNHLIAMFLYLVPAAVLTVLAHKGIGFSRGFYGGLCVLSLFGTFLFFMASVAPVDIVPSMSSSTIETVRNINSALAIFCASVFVGSLLGVCAYRKPIFGPKAKKA